MRTRAILGRRTEGDEWTEPELRRLERARLARDPRFDGTFFIAVVTTGIYCRPVCPATPPKPENVRYYRSAAGAAAAGFRPCLRCRPEASPGTPAWLGTSATVSRALRLIDEGALDEDRGERDDGRRPTEGLANRLGLGERHLRRLFDRHLGASPAAVARTRRVHFARRLLEETPLKIADVAFASGFGSLRAFNEAFRAAYGVAPRQVRTRRSGAGPAPAFTFRLGYRPPGDWPGLLGYLEPRTMPGVETVEDGAYRRLIRWQGSAAVLEVAPAPGGKGGALQTLELRLHAARPGEPPSANRLLELVTRVRRMFDLGADPDVVARTLRADPLLAARVRRFPGVRLPVAWDPFELAVRAILGQQVSVAAATTLAGRLVERFGEPVPSSDGGVASDALHTLFPTPARLAEEDLAVIGLPRARAEALRGLARAVADGVPVLDAGKPLDELIGGLCELPGIGPWTAHYVALRGLGVPDAFPAGDLGLRRALRRDSGSLPSAADVASRAEAWRPWRGYGALLLWREAA
ncbi:MAG TPA: AlkA N-terminal domain-containing protein [Thermoanaerobaculia bacterium]|nr:AlkA N-terminal domain-containing protein [Thermoanaerobaculia bacterium]